MVKGKWEYAIAELGTGIKCNHCGHKLRAKTVVMGDLDLSECPFCNTPMLDISDELMERMKEDAQ